MIDPADSTNRHSSENAPTVPALHDPVPHDPTLPNPVPHDPVPLIDASLGGPPALRALFTRRGPTAPEPQATLRSLSASIPWLTPRATAEQVHGAEVAVLDGPAHVPGVDALVTKKRDLALAIRVADCAAILLADPTPDGPVAAAHAGWRGAADRILSRTVHAMTELGAEPGRLLAWVSPCIGTERFEVGEEVAARFPAESVVRRSERPHVDLRGAVCRELLDLGLSPERIRCETDCTYEQADAWYSHRREGARAGRMWAAIVRLSAPVNRPG